MKDAAAADGGLGGGVAGMHSRSQATRSRLSGRVGRRRVGHPARHPRPHSGCPLTPWSPCRHHATPGRRRLRPHPSPHLSLPSAQTQFRSATPTVTRARAPLPAHRRLPDKVIDPPFHTHTRAHTHTTHRHRHRHPTCSILNSFQGVSAICADCAPECTSVLGCARRFGGLAIHACLQTRHFPTRRLLLRAGTEATVLPAEGGEGTLTIQCTADGTMHTMPLAHALSSEMLSALRIDLGDKVRAVAQPRCSPSTHTHTHIHHLYHARTHRRTAMPPLHTHAWTHANTNTSPHSHAT